MSRARQQWRSAAAFLAPNFVGFLIFAAGPIVFSLAAGFTNWDLQQTVPLRWTWFANYRELFRDAEFWLSLVNTVYLMLGIPIAIAGSLFLAVLLSRKFPGLVVYRTMFYLPTFTSGVALMILWKSLYNPDWGPINAVIDAGLRMLGCHDVSAPKWLISTANLLGLEVERVAVNGKQWGLGARDAIVAMGIWAAIGGNNMLLYIAALGNVPQQLHEAAAIDGAGRWAQFRYVTWPQLAPTTFFIVIMSFIGGLQGGFEQARVMTGGGPAGTTTTLAYFIYNKAFVAMRLGYASTAAWLLFGIIFAVTLANWKFGSRLTND